jgi:ribosomal protein S18 acetylase RimI-like enzyme
MDSEPFLGFVQLYPSYSSISMRRIWILNDLFVSPEVRNLGIGEKLIKHAIRFGKATGAKKLVLQTGKENKIAQNLYSRLEWVKDEDFWTYEFNL